MGSITQQKNLDMLKKESDGNYTKYNPTTTASNVIASSGKSVEEHLADTTTGAHKDKNINVVDANNHFTATTLNGVLDELFTFASSGKSAIATATGSPSTSSETFAQLATDITNGRNNIYNAVVGKGTTPVSKSYSDLVAGINAINTGRQSASGTSTANTSNKVVVTGLTFTPSIIIAKYANSDSTYFSRTVCQSDFDPHTSDGQYLSDVSDYVYTQSTGIGGSTGGASFKHQFIITSDGFQMFSGSGNQISWIAIS